MFHLLKKNPNDNNNLMSFFHNYVHKRTHLTKYKLGLADCFLLAVCYCTQYAYYPQGNNSRFHMRYIFHLRINTNQPHTWLRYKYLANMHARHHHRWYSMMLYHLYHHRTYSCPMYYNFDKSYSPTICLRHILLLRWQYMLPAMLCI